MMDDLLADGSQQQACEAASTTVPDDDQVRVLCLLQKDFRRLSFQRDTLTGDVRLQSLHALDRFARDRLRSVAERLDHGRVHT